MIIRRYCLCLAAFGVKPDQRHTDISDLHLRPRMTRIKQSKQAEDLPHVTIIYTHSILNNPKDHNKCVESKVSVVAKFSVPNLKRSR